MKPHLFAGIDFVVPGDQPLLRDPIQQLSKARSLAPRPILKRHFFGWCHAPTVNIGFHAPQCSAEATGHQDWKTKKSELR